MGITDDYGQLAFEFIVVNEIGSVRMYEIS